MSQGIDAINELVREKSTFIPRLKSAMQQVVIGQDYLMNRLVTGLLANGHMLIEGVPGLAKTLTVRSLAAALDTSFQRIQFTPDLLPADLVGTLVYNPKSGTFSTQKGPIFANVILADEINRSPAKVQSALLEAMQERQVTISQETYPLPRPFLVLATQNPLEQQGTYPLPEAQIDRFIMKLNLSYPSFSEERQILERYANTEEPEMPDPVIDPETIFEARKVVNEIYMDDKIKEYILKIVFATRDPQSAGLELDEYIRYGASPRASIYLALAARSYAFIQGRGYVSPQDVKSIAPDVLRHRVIVSYEAEAEELDADDIVKKVIDKIRVP